MPSRNRNRWTLTTGEIAKFCDVSAATVKTWIDKGYLKGFWLPKVTGNINNGKGYRRVHRKDLVDFMNKRGFSKKVVAEILSLECPKVACLGVNQNLVDQISKDLGDECVVVPTDTPFELGWYWSIQGPFDVVVIDWSIGRAMVLSMSQELRKQTSNPSIIGIIPDDFPMDDPIYENLAGVFKQDQAMSTLSLRIKELIT